MWNVECEMLNVECWMLDVKCWMWNLEWGMRHGNILPQIADEHRNHAGCFIKKTRDSAKPLRPTEGNCTDAHGWVFSRIVYTCSAAYCLGFDAPPAQRIDTDFFAGGELCGRMSHDGLAWYAKNLWKSARSVGDK